jgi:hypothetical protein
MSASIDVTGLALFSKSLRRAVSGDLQRELVKSIQDAGPKIVIDMHGAAHTKIQQRAVGTVTMAKTTDGIDISGGRGSSLGAVLFDGGEYGGRKSKKVTYATRSPLGKAYVINRRTTMQFLPHLGKSGYFFWPTIRDWMTKLAKDQEAAVNKAMGAR